MKIILSILFLFTLSFSKGLNYIYTDVFFEINIKNSKFLVIEKKIDSYIFKAYNKKNSEVQSCEWIKNFTYEDLLKIKKLFSSLDQYKKVENQLVKITNNKKGYKFLFKKSQCNVNHKFYYFQKDCNKDFILILTEDQVFDIFSNLKLI